MTTIVQESQSVTLDQDGIWEVDIPVWWRSVHHAHVAPGPGRVAVVEADAGEGTRLIVCYGEPGQTVELLWTEIKTVPVAPNTPDKES